MINIDMWYGNRKEDAEKIDINFYPNDPEYRGNIWIGGKIVGDYVCNDLLLLKKVFCN